MSLNRWMRNLITLLISLVLGSALAWADRAETPRLSLANMQETYSLAGDWQFHPGDDLGWASPTYNDSNWVDRGMPERWPIGGFPEFEQFGWYRLTLKFDVNMSEARDNLSNLGVRIGKVLSAYELYAGGKLIGGVGKLPPLSEINHDRTRVFPVPVSAIAEDGTLVLAMRVWGGSELAVSTWGGGPYEGSFRIGNYARLLQMSFISEVPGLMASVLFLGFGFYHIYLYRRNRQLQTYLWYGFMAVDIGVYGLMLNQWRYRMDWSFISYEKLEFGTIYLFPALSIAMVWSLLGRRVGPLLRLYQCSFIVLAIIVVSVPGFDIHYYSLRPWQMWSIGLLIALPWMIIREAKSGNLEARTALIGVLVFAAACTNDLMIDLAGWKASRLVPLGFVAIMLSVAISLANKFTNVLTDLEGEVSQRTADLRSANRRLAEVARMDPLTGLLNRRGFTEVAEAEIQRFLRTGREFSIILADLDNFKKFNDQYGHACGDHVLQEAAYLLRNKVRDVDEVARWGGEEFMVILPETCSEGASLAAEKLRSLVQDKQYEYDGHRLSVTMTFGVATFRKKGETLDSCIARADMALYNGKKQGRNRVMIEGYTGLSLIS